MISPLRHVAVSGPPIYNLDGWIIFLFLALLICIEDVGYAQNMGRICAFCPPALFTVI